MKHNGCCAANVGRSCSSRSATFLEPVDPQCHPGRINRRWTYGNNAGDLRSIYAVPDEVTLVLTLRRRSRECARPSAAALGPALPAQWFIQVARSCSRWSVVRGHTCRSGDPTAAVSRNPRLHVPSIRFTLTRPRFGTGPLTKNQRRERLRADPLRVDGKDLDR